MIYKTKVFQGLFKKSNLSDDDLKSACNEMALGLIDADLGSNLYKKRVAMPGKGKRASYRTMIGAVIGSNYFFLYMFAKSDRANITKLEKVALQELAKEFIGYDKTALDQLVKSGELLEVG